MNPLIYMMDTGWFQLRGIGITMNERDLTFLGRPLYLFIPWDLLFVIIFVNNLLLIKILL